LPVRHFNCACCSSFGEFRLKKKLRIAINAQIPSGSGAGGIETVLRILTALGRLDDGDEEYVFISHWADPDWLKPLLSERQTIVCAPQMEATQKPRRAENLRRVLRPLARGIKRMVAPQPREQSIGVPTSNGFYESLNCDVIHFPYQDYVFCRVPTVYNPHDLQHLHYPQFFAPEEIQRREIVYRTACRAAHTVVTGSQFVKRDVADRYEISADKIQVIPWSPPATVRHEFTEKEASAVFEKYDCPPRPFALYPAMTWEHKNHIRLLEAVALLRERDGLKINVVCTGHKNSFYPQIERRLRDLRLDGQIKFTGIVDYKELKLLYRTAQFVVIPTLFEAASGPLFEAWQHGAPAACSSVTSLPEQAAGAALFFDPFSVEEIADAIKKMSSDENLRAELVARGVSRLENFDPERTSKAYRAVYRKAAGAALTDEDEHLLNWDWMRDSRRGFRTAS